MSWQANYSTYLSKALTRTPTSAHFHRWPSCSTKYIYCLTNKTHPLSFLNSIIIIFFLNLHYIGFAGEVQRRYQFERLAKTAQLCRSLCPATQPTSFSIVDIVGGGQRWRASRLHLVRHGFSGRLYCAGRHVRSAQVKKNVAVCSRA